MYTGITLATFGMDENTPDEKDRLNMSASWVEISFFNSFTIWVERLLGTVDLSLFSKDIIKFTSCASVGAIKDINNMQWIS